MKKIPKKVQKILNTNKKITENLHHKCKVLKRKQDIEKVKNDIDNGYYQIPWNTGTHIRGIKPEKKTDWFKIGFYTITGLIAVALAWVVIITIIDLIYG